MENFKLHGPYTRQDGRKIVIVVENNGKRRTVSYPKWLMEMQLGRKLNPDLETIDHIDSNFNNNDLSNLRIVERKEHSGDDTRRVKNLNFDCAWCDTNFERSPRLVRDKAKKNKAGPFCSRSCAGKYSRMLQLKLIDKLKPQPNVPSEYYKRKYVIASADIEDIDFDILDLIAYASTSLRTQLMGLRSEIAAAAQKVIDDWEVDENGEDVEFGSGGACDAVQSEMYSIIGRLPGVEIVDGGHDGDDHAYVIVYNMDEAYAVDIPPGVYETGSGYNWKKIPNAVITPEDVIIDEVDRDDVAGDLD